MGGGGHLLVEVEEGGCPDLGSTGSGVSCCGSIGASTGGAGACIPLVEQGLASHWWSRDIHCNQQSGGRKN